MRYKKYILNLMVISLVASMVPLQADPALISETIVVVVEKAAAESASSNIGLAAQCLCDATYNIGCGVLTIGKVCYKALPSPLTVSRAVLTLAKLGYAGSQVLRDHPIILAGLIGFAGGYYVKNTDVLDRVKKTLPGQVKRVTLKIVDTSGRLVGWAIGSIA